MWEQSRRATQARFPGVHQTLWSVFLVVFIAGGLFSGYLFYASIRDIVAYAELPFIVGGPVGVVDPDDPWSPGPISELQLTERVNVLLLGIDRRDGEPGPWRTDTMILFSLDPISQTASMLSIPRDLWVRMPGLQIDERINAACVIGEQIGYPGGGPAFAKKAVQYNLGIPVHYYVRIDFRGFERTIDMLEGIDVDVPREIIDYEYPTPDYGTMRLHIKPGLQHMDGDLALKYARTRHNTSDIDRARRQQQVIMAVRDKALKLDFPLARIPGLLRTMGDSVKTDMSPDEIYAIARAAREVEGENIRQGVIDETMVISWTTAGGAEVLVLQRERVRVLVSELFPVATRSPASGPLGDRDRLAQEGARIEVQNGTQVVGLASKMAADLRSAGYNVVRYGNADRADYAETVIVYYTDKRYSLDSLRTELKIADAQVSRQQDPDGDVDIRIILGANAVQQ